MATLAVQDGIDEIFEGEFDLPMIAYTPYAIFSNTIPVFDINFFSPNYETSSASILQSTVSSWYKTLRNVAIVGLMLVLLYIGIRIVISSVNDKAKYKERLIDWVVAICLVFLIHYIMVFVVEITEQIDLLFANSSTENILVQLPVDTKINGEQLEADEETGYPIWACNFVGYSRLLAGGYANYDTLTSIEFTVIYIVLVIYTVVFSLMYLKRVLYMAFLTMIAPLVVLTYPIDKIHDNEAQGFNTWLKEYIFNALLQPFHMLIYSILIGSVMDLALDYPVYALVALGFLIPAEKMLRKMFGFEKAQSPSSMGALSVAGAGLLMSGLGKLSHRPKRLKEDDDERKSNNDNVRMKSDEFDTNENYANENLNGITNKEQNRDENKDEYDANYNPRNDSSYNIVPKETPVNTSNNTTPKNNSSNISNKRLQPQSSKKKRVVKNRLGNAFMAVGTRYSRKLQNSHPLRTLRRGVTYGLGASALGMVGLAAGIASGDLGKTAQYVGTAGIVGGKLGSSIGDSLSHENRANVETFKQGWYGEDYQDKIRKNMIKKAQTDPNNIQYLRERTSNYREILKKDYPEYARYGCKDIEDFWAAYQLEQDGASRSTAISTYNLAQRTGDISKSPDKEEKWKKKLIEEFRQTSVVKSQQKEKQEQLSKQLTESALDRVKLFYKGKN